VPLEAPPAPDRPPPEELLDVTALLDPAAPPVAVRLVESVEPALSTCQSSPRIDAQPTSASAKPTKKVPLCM
jgi:hypothetical protein